MIAVAVVCFPIFFTGQRIARWEGGLFLAYYLIYMLYLVLSESHADHYRRLRHGPVGFCHCEWLPVPLLLVSGKHSAGNAVEGQLNTPIVTRAEAAAQGTSTVSLVPRLFTMSAQTKGSPYTMHHGR